MVTWNVTAAAQKFIEYFWGPKMPPHVHIARDQTRYEKTQQIHHVKINSQNQLVILGYTSHRVENLMFSSNIYLIKKILFFYDHFIILTESGAVWVCGSNENGKLGLGDVPRVDRVVQLEIPRIERLYSDGETCLMYSEVGEAYTMGRNKKNSATTADIHGLPTRKPDLDHLQQVLVLDYSLYTLDEAGTVTITHEQGKEPIAKKIKFMTAEKRQLLMFGDGMYHKYGTDKSHPSKFGLYYPKKEKVIEYASCGNATFLLNDNNELRIRGDISDLRCKTGWTFTGTYDEIKREPSMDGKRVTHVTCGTNHAVFVTDNGNDTRVYGVGSNFSGQLGLPYETEEVQDPIEIRWKNMFPDGMHYFANWHIQAVGCSQHNTYLWLTMKGKDFFSLLHKNTLYADVEIVANEASLR